MRIHPLLIGGIGALALAACGGDQTFLLTRIERGTALPESSHIRALQASIDLDGRQDMTRMLTPGVGGEFILPRTLSLEVGSGEGDAVVTVDAYGDNDALLSEGSTELVFARGETADVTVELGRHQRLSPDAPEDLSHLTISPNALVNFGTRTVGTVTPQTFRVTNDGTGDSPPLDAHLSSTSTPFAIARNDCDHAVLAPHDTCTFDVELRPAVQGQWSSNVLVMGQGETVARVSASVAGYAVLFSLSPASLDFGNVSMTASASLPVRVINQTPTAIASLAWQIDGTDPSQFSIDTATTTCISNDTLAAQSECTIGIRFAPSSTGSKAATLNVITGAEWMPLALTGTGIN